MADIFDIKKERQKRGPNPLGSYFVRVDKYEDGISGAVLDLGDDLSPDELRIVSNHLATLSRWLRDQAADTDGNEDENQIAEFRMFRSGRVWAYLSDEIEAPVQADWVRDRPDDAKKIVGAE